MADTLKGMLRYDLTFDCVQCGYCLPVCPTYETMERETHSPRGRINLIKMVAEGKASVEDLKQPIDKCLGCMACTTVCPTDVQYGQLFESAKHVIDEYEEKTFVQQKTEHFLFHSFFPSAAWMHQLGNATWLYQVSGLQKAARGLNLMSAAPLHLGKFEQVLPPVPSPKERHARKNRLHPAGPPKAVVAFFTGCVMDSVFFRQNEKTMELLRLSGAEVQLPKTQTCCGALHAHAGKEPEAVELAKQNIQAFEEKPVDYIVNNAGGCGAQLHKYGELFAGDPEWEERAKAFSDRVRDITEVLVELDGLEFTERVEETYTYQPSCHMTNVQKVKEPPLQLIRSVPGVTLKELDRPDFCCGSAGIYNITQHEDAMDILDVKMKDVKRQCPEGIVTTNPGCMLQMKLGVQREGLEEEIDTVHIVDLLMKAKPVTKKTVKA
ncbi:(Fe-S)-binding protein [Marinococcus halotolerans]|uniref:(Fe-S)-binding protein n=1 Tax=Marinococcus halotolerans TaxID=301092 RepID=UPI0003B3AAF2|nr:(Fe-S)-binding protein [Marinococcus halotolerans]